MGFWPFLLLPNLRNADVNFIQLFYLMIALTFCIFLFCLARYIPVRLQTKNWYLLNRLNTIALRWQEHGLSKYFKSLSERTFKQKRTTEMRSSSLDPLVATAGGLEEILIACVIYLVGIVFGIFTFIFEIFRKWNFP